MPRSISEEYLKKHQGCVLCYSGSKARVLKEIYEELPDEEGLSVCEPFYGGGSLGSNLPIDYKLTVNDMEYRVMEIHQNLNRLLKEGHSPKKIESMIKKYCHMWVGDNKDVSGYDLLKHKYNNNVTDNILTGNPFWLDLFALTMSSNTNYIRFNNIGEQNLNFGKRYYNSNSSKKMLNYLERLNERDITMESKDFREYDFTKYDLIISDSPYSYNGKSVATYNEKGGWQFKDLVNLLSKLDAAHEAGRKFLFFNESVTKGTDNTIIQEWMKKYKVRELKDTFTGCSYQRTEKRSVEVLVKNY